MGTTCPSIYSFYCANTNKLQIVVILILIKIIGTGREGGREGGERERFWFHRTKVTQK